MKRHVILVVDGVRYDGDDKAAQYYNLMIIDNPNTIEFDQYGLLVFRGLVGMRSYCYKREPLGDVAIQTNGYLELKYMLHYCYEQNWFSDKIHEIVVLDDERAMPILGYVSL